VTAPKASLRYTAALSIANISAPDAATYIRFLSLDNSLSGLLNVLRQLELQK
jgi:hypothetical protein